MISTATNTVTATAAGFDSPLGIAFAQHFTAYVANPAANTVSVVDTASNTITGTIAVGGHPVAVAVTPDGSTAYVADALGTRVGHQHRDRYRHQAHHRRQHPASDQRPARTAGTSSSSTARARSR